MKLSTYTVEPSVGMDESKDLYKNGKQVPCFMLNPLITPDGAIMRLPCNSKCLHFEMVVKEEKVCAQFTCGGVGVLRIIENLGIGEQPKQDSKLKLI